MQDVRVRLGCGLLALLLPLAALAEEAPAPDAADAPMPLVMPGYAGLEGFKLTVPGGTAPLTQRHVEVVIVEGEVDPPYADGDDRIDLVNTEYNEPRFKELMNANPGMVTATMTVFIEEKNPKDNKIQVWETVMVRVYNADQKAQATHYCDTTTWKAQPGFLDVTPEQVQFGPWRPIEKPKAKSKPNGRAQ